MNKEQSKLLTRSIIFTITLMGFLIFIIFDLTTSVQYQFGENHIPFTWLIFWTHLSNIGALVWITIALFSSITKKRELELFVNRWFFKNLVFTFIIVTGIVFMSLAYIPTLIKFLTPGPIEPDFNPSTFYRVMVVVGTTFKHLIIPGMFIFLAVKEREYTEEKTDLSKRKKSMILFIFPSLYFIYVMLLTSSIGTPAPYPVLDFVSGNYNPLSIFLFLFLDLMVAILFCLVSFWQFWWVEKN